MVSALNCAQTTGLAGELKIAHLLLSSRWMHFTPDGFPSGIPGSGDDIDGAMQQAPQLSRQSIN
jgi:hypothetical protein